MSITSFQTAPNSSNPVTVIRLDRAITQQATLWGYDGDPLADRIPQARTQGDLEAAHDLLQTLPAELQNIDRDLALRMCQAVVFGSNRTANDTWPPNPPACRSAQSKLSRERNLNQQRRVG